MEKIIIQKSDVSIRIDKFLKEEVFLNMDITRGEIIRQIKSGNISVNEKIVKPSYLLKENDEIRIKNKELGIKNRGNISANAKVKFEIIFENENFIVINKPAGLAVHPSAKNENDTLVNGLLYKFPEIKNVGDDPGARPGIVHRLDKETSGVMLAARNQKTFEELKNKFKNREIEKNYLALVLGNPKNKKGTIEKSIARSADYKKQVIAGKKTKTKIRPAITEYEVVQNYNGFSLVRAFPKTGRMHQIRVHLFSIGHPVAGDKKYKLKKQTSLERPCRQLLHAEKINFSLFGQKYSFIAKPSRDFEKFLGLLDENRIKS